ncbi:lipoprotein [Streptomyces sp. NPDC005925]|uniref:lipoprotein n=1 Tax=Streptomyces sp. NPDC005925 TaxID=3157172 RepID=UPI0033DF2CD6
MGNEGRAAAVCAALLVGVLAGCSGGGAGPDAKRSSDAKPAPDRGNGVARSGGRIGAAGSACELPVVFDTAADWTAEAVDGVPGGSASSDTSGHGDGDGDGDGSGADDELAQEIADSLLHQGPVTAACEIDAKPAGHIGFLRVWTGEPDTGGDARSVLEDFVAAEDGASRAKYRALAGGGLEGAEVTYLCTSKLLGETKTERALAVETPDGPVVLHLGGMDGAEHEAMLPAYELAKRTLRLS